MRLILKDVALQLLLDRMKMTPGKRIFVVDLVPNIKAVARTNLMKNGGRYLPSLDHSVRMHELSR